MLLSARHFFRYCVVGTAQNLFGYILYIIITWANVDPKIAITILYPIGFTLSYFGNKKWTFSHSGGHSQAVVRFTLTHIIGYIINLVLLYVLVDVYGYNHQYIQLLAMAILVFYFFIALKLYVFKGEISMSGA